MSEETARFDKRQNQITNCIGAGETGRVYDYMIQRPETDSALTHKYFSIFYSYFRSFISHNLQTRFLCHKKPES